MAETFRALRSRNYRLFFIGQTLSLIGTWMQTLAMSWLVLRLTGSAVMLGTVALASQIPMLISAPFGGVLSDRVNRRRLLILTQSLALAQAAVLAALVLAGLIQTWQILVLSACLGIINAFDMPNRQAFVPELVEDRKDLSNVIALNSAQFNLARLIGPAIAGAMITLVGEGMCFLLNAISFVAVIVAVIMMRVPHDRHTVTSQHPLAELVSGARYAWQLLPVRSLLALIAVVGCATGALQQVFLPVYAKQVYDGNSLTFGVMLAAVAVGALAAALMLAQRKSVIGLSRWILIAAALSSVTVGVFGLTRNVWEGLPILVIFGFGAMKHMASTNTLIQTIVDDEKKGRVMSFYAMAMVGSMPVGSFLSGLLSRLIGSTLTLAVFSMIGSIAVLGFLRVFPKFRQQLRPIYESKGIRRAEGTG